MFRLWKWKERHDRKKLELQFIVLRSLSSARETTITELTDLLRKEDPRLIMPWSTASVMAYMTRLVEANFVSFGSYHDEKKVAAYRITPLGTHRVRELRREII